VKKISETVSETSQMAVLHGKKQLHSVLEVLNNVIRTRFIVKSIAR